LQRAGWSDPFVKEILLACGSISVKYISKYLSNIPFTVVHFFACGNTELKVEEGILKNASTILENCPG